MAAGRFHWGFIHIEEKLIFQKNNTKNKKEKYVISVLFKQHTA